MQRGIFPFCLEATVQLMGDIRRRGGQGRRSKGKGGVIERLIYSIPPSSPSSPLLLSSTEFKVISILFASFFLLSHALVPPHPFFAPSVTFCSPPLHL